MATGGAANQAGALVCQSIKTKSETQQTEYFQLQKEIEYASIKSHLAYCQGDLAGRVFTENFHSALQECQ